MRKATEGRNDGRGMWGLVLVLVLLTPSVLPSFRRLAAQSDTNRARAVAILRTVPLIDGHNDIPDAIRERGGLDSDDFAVSQPKLIDRKSTRLNSSHGYISYAVFCLKKKNK